MPIEVYCDSCQKKLRVPDTAAGKRIKCPKCQGIISVPTAAGGDESPSGAMPTVPKTIGKSSPALATPKVGSASPKSGLKRAPVEQWHVQTEDGQQYGPVSRQELDQWYADGRITVDTQLLRDGSDQWQWASDLYPDLAPQDETPTETGIPDFGAIAAATGGGAAKGSGAFDFGAASGPAATTSVAARTKGKKGGKRGGSRGKKGGGSPHIDYLAYASYAMGGLGVLFAIIFMVAGGSVAAMVAGADAEGAAAASGAVGTMTMIISVIMLLISSVWFAAGYGLQQRAGWGRILTLVLGALNILSFPIGTALGVWAFMVLLDKDNAAAFS